jgi:tetratricopeptide (TPR) repeat protein
MGDKQIIPEPPRRRKPEFQILSEAPPALAVVLWQYIRHVKDWIDAHPEIRHTLFNANPPRWVVEKRRAAYAMCEEHADELTAIERMMDRPDDVREDELADACERLARWAESQGYPETAIELAETAARLDCGEPRRANLAGRLTRNAKEYGLAETWFERGIGLARRRADWVEYTRGHLGAGIMCMWTGREAPARRHLNTASTIAMREGHEWLAAEAQHDLFHFMTVRGNYVDAELHARRALAWYPKHHHRFPFFSADVAYLLVCQRHYSAAIRVLRHFLSIVGPPKNLLGLSLLVRALACAGELDEFAAMRVQLLKSIPTDSEYESAARWHLAYGERAAGLRDLAKVTARTAVEIARTQRDREMEVLALAALQEIESGQPAQHEIARNDGNFTEFVSGIISRLQTWSPTRRGRNRSRSEADWAA